MNIRFYIKIFFIGLFSCTSNKTIDSNDFYIRNYNLKSDIKILTKDVIHIKNNIYEYQGILYLSIDDMSKMLNNNKEIINVKLGNFLLDSLGHKPIKNIIDLDSYKSLINEYIHIDKNNLYISQVENGCHHCIKVLNVNVDKLKILDKRYTYASDGDKIYCLRYGEEIKTKFPNTFKVIELNGSPYGIDSTSIYSMCEPMPPSDFMKYYDNIEYKVRDSIVKKYFD